MPVVGSPLENGRHALSDEQLSSLVDYERGRVHASVYTDADVFAEEMRRIFHRSWVYLGHESEIALPGDYKTTYIGQIPVIISRTEDGRMHGVVNRCVHRGTTVCQMERGNASYFRCEYHGWTYRNSGELIGITQKSGYAAEELDGIPESLESSLGWSPTAGSSSVVSTRGRNRCGTSSVSRLTTSTTGWTPHRRARSSSPVGCGGIAIGRTGRSVSKGRMSGITPTSSTRPCER